MADESRSGSLRALSAHGDNTFRGIDRVDLHSSVTRVTYTSDEVTALCPVTGQPDLYTVAITISDSPYGIESKSLKLYLQTFRQAGIMAEALAATIAGRILGAIAEPPIGEPKVVVEVSQKPRGGVAIAAIAERS